MYFLPLGSSTNDLGSLVYGVLDGLLSDSLSRPGYRGNPEESFSSYVSGPLLWPALGAPVDRGESEQQNPKLTPPGVNTKRVGVDYIMPPYYGRGIPLRHSIF